MRAAYILALGALAATATAVELEQGKESAWWELYDLRSSGQAIGPVFEIVQEVQELLIESPAESQLFFKNIDEDLQTIADNLRDSQKALTRVNTIASAAIVRLLG